MRSCLKTAISHLQLRTKNEKVAMAAEVTVDVMIRGYYIYRDIWSAVVDEQLTCKREPSDLFAIVVVTTVRHVPRMHMPRGHHART